MERLSKWKAAGYGIEIIFLWLPSAELAKARVKIRVRHGGHNVPENDIARRYIRGWANFEKHYAGLADTWSVFDNSVHPPQMLKQFP